MSNRLETVPALLGLRVGDQVQTGAGAPLRTVARLDRSVIVFTDGTRAWRGRKDAA